MLFIIVLLGICYLGYLAQTTGLCMVRGVNEWKSGNKEFLLSIMFSGILIWVSASFAHFSDIEVSFKAYQISSWFIFGGFLFGLGTAFNKGCGISTLSRLTRGDSKMFATIVGWLIGWTILAYLSPKVTLIREPLPADIPYVFLIIISFMIIVWVSLSNKKRQKQWFSMMGIGLLSGFIYLYQPKWPPNALLNQLSQALCDDKLNSWPALEQYIFFIVLLIGMFIAAWHTKKFIFIPSNINLWIKHSLAGTLMGIGAALAMGGNSVQLLMALPVLSPAGFSSVGGILLGIWCGLYIRKFVPLLN
jgi:uncharacterized membrane protein YedE/YeeE